ncbi:MAG: TonB-dependent receptor domain-containing protein, partial [Luteimonas sp.]
ARDAIADPVTGQAVCRDATARAAGCIPFNIFSMQAPSREVMDYVLADRKEQRRTGQQVFGAEINGPLMGLPAGEINFVLGAEHRRETLETRDDPLALSGELVYGGGAAAHPELDVDFDVSEAYAEIVVPVFADQPFARRLDFEAAYRYSDYSTVGGTDAWKLGLIWEPIEGLAFRGVSSRSVRTPNFGELYEPRVDTMTGSINDPCEVASYYATDQRAANCLALGVTEPLVDYKIGPTVTTGGNPDLEPETSDSLTFGMVWQPRFLPGFDVTVDYWDIDIGNVITQFGYATLMRLCVDAPTIDNPYCARIDRDPATQEATAVRSNQLNAARMYAKGVDLGASYVRGTESGLFGATLKATRLLDMVTETTPGIPAGDVEYAGSWQNPDYRATLTLDYRVNALNFAVSTRYHGSGAYDLNTDSDEAYPDGNRVGSATYHDLALGFDFSERYRIGFGVKNLFDRQAPYKPTVYRDTSIYDQVGRYFYLTARATF